MVMGNLFDPLGETIDPSSPNPSRGSPVPNEIPPCSVRARRAP
jgi:hypothetical protein